jgi:hypothetical protein
VLVGAGEEKSLPADLAVEARQAVGDDLLVGVAEMRFGVHVVDRGGDIEARRHENSRQLVLPTIRR